LRTQNPGATAPGRCDDQSNSESPAYSHGGHESAGFSGYGIQQATRLQRATSIIAVGIIGRSGGGVKRFVQEKFVFFRWGARPLSSSPQRFKRGYGRDQRCIAPPMELTAA